MQERDRGTVTLVLGGARSGKSRYAQALASGFTRVVYIATAVAGDLEMSEKIRRHQEERPRSWHTIEEPLNLGASLKTHASLADCVLVDCLTVFSSNLLEALAEDVNGVERRVKELLEALSSSVVPIILVSNEVGSGVVPAYPLGRRYRDLLGEINQKVASLADRVVLMVAGLPLTLKDHPGVQP